MLACKNETGKTGVLFGNISNCLRSKHYQEALDECNKILVNYPKEHTLAMHALEAKARTYIALKEYDNLSDNSTDLLLYLRKSKVIRGINIQVHLSSEV